MSKVRSIAVAFFSALLFACFTFTTLIADDPPVDTIRLKNGGVLYGFATKVKEDKQHFYIIKTPDGATLKLKVSQVAEVKKPSPALEEYSQKKVAMADTVDGHWEMQQWCIKNRLYKQRDFHLIRIVELDPDHKDARGLLDHKDYNGVWFHRDHFMQNQGYIKIKRGDYRMPESIEMDSQKDVVEKEVTVWTKNVKGWMNKLKKRNDPEARRNLEGIRNPAAVAGLMRMYNARNQDFAVKRMIVEILGQIEAYQAQNALVTIATATSQESLALAERAISMLKQPHFSQRQVAATVRHWLRPGPTTSRNAQILVNRAAWLIGHMEDTDSVRKLIDALNTTHTVPTGAPGGNINLQNNNRGKGMTFGSQKKTMTISFRNESVLDTLRLLTDVDFGFDEEAWIDWYIHQQSLGTHQLGRDR